MLTCFMLGSILACPGWLGEEIVTDEDPPGAPRLLTSYYRTCAPPAGYTPAGAMIPCTIDGETLRCPVPEGTGSLEEVYGSDIAYTNQNGASIMLTVELDGSLLWSTDTETHQPFIAMAGNDPQDFTGSSFTRDCTVPPIFSGFSESNAVYYIVERP